MFCFHPEALQDDEDIYDIVYALGILSTNPSGQFDTVIVMDGDNTEATGLEGLFKKTSIFVKC